jgi:hypothetical protein
MTDQSHIVKQRQPTKSYIVVPESGRCANRLDIRKQIRVAERHTPRVPTAPGCELEERQIRWMCRIGFIYGPFIDEQFYVLDDLL